VTEHAPPAPKQPPADEADVIVVGAGPSGATTAFYLAQSGLDVLVLEKSRFPREKVCGDGLTPRAVKTLVNMGISVGEQDGWVRNKGLRVIGAGKRLELPWPELASYPGYGLVRTRLDLDETLARRAQQAGARLFEGVTVTGPVLDERTGRITGVVAKAADGGEDPTYRARVVVAADGNSSRLSVAMGLRKRDDDPSPVAAIPLAVRGFGHDTSDPPAALVQHRAGHRDALEQPRAGLLGPAGQRLVQVVPGADQAVAGIAGQLGPGQFQPLACADDAQALVAHPAVLLADADAHADQGLYRARGQPVAADLLPREPGFLQQQHVQPGLRQVESGGGAGWPGAHDDDVGFVSRWMVRGGGSVLGHLIKSWCSCEPLHKFFAISLDPTGRGFPPGRRSAPVCRLG